MTTPSIAIKSEVRGADCVLNRRLRTAQTLKVLLDTAIFTANQIFDSGLNQVRNPVTRVIQTGSSANSVMIQRAKSRTPEPIAA